MATDPGRTLLDAIRDSDAFAWLSDRTDPILLAVSGGPDSTALLILVHRLVSDGPLSTDLVVGHVVHDLRENGPEDDRRFVENLARERDLPHATAHVDVRHDVQTRSVSPEACARRARYDALTRMAREHGCCAVLTGHHEDDQIETLLLRLLRGTGLQGLTGIPARRPLADAPDEVPDTDEPKPFFLLRPLLNVPKQTLKSFLRAQNQGWRRDPTNQRNTYRRNRVRTDLVPAVRSHLGPSYPELLLRIRRRAIDVTDRLAAIWNDSIPPHLMEGDTLFVDRSALRDLSPILHPYLLRWIRSTLNCGDERPTYHDLRRLREVLDRDQTGRAETLSGDLLLRLEHRYLVGREQTAESTSPPDPVTLDGPAPDQETWGAWIVRIRAGESVDPTEGTTAFRDNPWRERIDGPSVHGSITIGPRQNGDRIRPLGMDGRKKIKDVLIDRRVPASLRDRWPIVRDTERVIWIPGLCLSHDVRVRPDTASEQIRQLICTRADEANDRSVSQLYHGICER